MFTRSTLLIFNNHSSLLPKNCPNGRRPDPQWTKRRAKDSSYIALLDPPSPRTPRLRQNQDLNRTRRVPAVFETWLPPSGCHLLHIHNQGES